MPLSASEASIEAEIRIKNLTGVRLTPADIDEAIVGEAYWIVPLSTTTVCALYLQNGFIVIGHSACADASNFDAAIGQRIARDRAREQIWQLEGYLLRERLSVFEEAQLVKDSLGE